MTREARKGQNEAWFRDLNERLESRALSKPGNDELFEIVCECSREECTERISITIPVYESVRQAPTAFIIVPGHGDPTTERVVSSSQAYDLVEKLGDAAVVAQIEDPRSG
jgi:hypothetical protein